MTAIHLPTKFSSQLLTDFGWEVWVLNEPLWFDPSLKGYGFSLVAFIVFGFLLSFRFILFVNGMISLNQIIKKNGG